MKINLKLSESNAQINSSILSILRDRLTYAFNRSIPNIVKNIKTILKSSIEKQPEYASLIGGRLRLEFGIADTSIVDNVIVNIIDATNFEFKNIKQGTQSLTGGFAINFLSSENLYDITNSSSAFVVDGMRGYELPWLRWLVIEGTKPIVKNYIVKFGPNKSSRTGMALMVNSSSNWSVPSQFAGTVSSNWISRAVDDISDSSISSIIENEIRRNI